MGILKDAILAAIQQEHPDAHWVGNEKPHMIESTAQAKYNDVRRVERTILKAFTRQERRQNKMATLIKTDGSKLEIQPQNGLDFQLDELQKFVDGYIEIINLHNGDILVINDNGKDVLDSNETATEIAHKHNAIFGWDYICGDVVMCKDREVL